MTLLELAFVLALSALLVLGLVQVAAAASSSTRLQRNQAQLQENSRHAIKTLSKVIRQAGFNPLPWDTDFQSLGLDHASADNISSAGDRLAVREWSDLNCFDNRNPDTDTSGTPLFYVRESVFDVNTEHSLTRTCRYGPSPAELVTQVRRQGFVNGIESFQLLYGQDSDRDGNIESWVRAGDWDDIRHIIGVRAGLVISSEDPVVEPAARSLVVLDATVTGRADGRLRRAVVFSSAIRSRSG